jgi:phosphate transport system substrate-binding protein
MNGSFVVPKLGSFCAVGLAIVALWAAGCHTAPAERRDVRIAGSDTMLDLNRRLAEAFMRANPGVAVLVEGGGTGSGIKALLERRVDLAAASRPFTPDEVSGLFEEFGTIGLRFLVARDALSVFIHPANPIRDLDQDQLRALFTGESTNWSAVGGYEEQVVVVNRPPNSGTHRFFRDHVLRGTEYVADAVTVPRTVDVVSAVGAHPGAIGYGAVIFGTELPKVRIDGVEGSVDNVRDGSYPLGRYLYFYATAPPDGNNKLFLDWSLGPEGQAVVSEVGFVPLWMDP